MFTRKEIVVAVGCLLCISSSMLVEAAHAAPQISEGAVAVDAAAVVVKVVPAGADSADIQRSMMATMSKLGTAPRTLAEVNEWSDALTRVLRQGGYPIGTVLMTADDWKQTQQGKTARFTVFPGRISKITVSNTSRVKVSKLERLVTHALCGNETLDGACLLRTSRLERTTQLLQDLPGVSIDGAPQLKPGQGTGDIEVVFKIAQRGKPVSGDIILDNSGSDATGKLRTGVAGTANNLFGIGDAYTFSIARTNENMWTGALIGSAPIGDDGLQVTGGVTRQQYNINSVAGAALQGISTTGQIGLRYPITRGLDRNVWANALLLHSNNSTAYEGFDSQHSKLDSVQLSMQADNGDRAKQLRTDQWSGQLALTMGHQSNDLGTFDETGPNVAGNYAKLTAGGYATHALTQSGNTFLMARASTQWAAKNLDASEKLNVGGPDAVRAYRSDEGSLDEGAIFSLGVYQRVPIVAGHQLQFGLFSDFAVGRVNHSPWANWEKSYVGVPGVQNTRVLAGYGLSTDWLTPWGATVSASVSKAYGFSQTSWVEPGKKPTQFWLSVTWSH